MTLLISIIVVIIIYFLWKKRQRPIVMIAMNDDEGWLESYVLKNAGYNIKQVIFYDNLLIGLALAKPYIDDGYDLLVCGHTSPRLEMSIEFKKKESDDISIDDLLTKYKAKYVATCYWDIKTNQPTKYENTPGFTHNGAPCHYMINDTKAMNVYLEWLKQLRESVSDVNAIKDTYMIMVLPKLQKYTNDNAYVWQYQLL